MTYSTISVGLLLLVSVKNSKEYDIGYCQRNLHRVERGFREPFIDEFPRLKKNEKFTVQSTVEHDRNHALCNTKISTNVTISYRGETIAGSNGISFSEEFGGRKNLVCKSKAFKITFRDGTIRRILAEGSAVIGTSKEISKIFHFQTANSKTLEIASRGRSAISNRAVKKEVVSAVETQGMNAGTAAMSKSRKMKQILESVSSVEGGTAMDDNALGIRSWSKSAMHLFTNIRQIKENFLGHGQGLLLTYMSHHKKSTFEIEI